MIWRQQPSLEQLVPEQAQSMLPKKSSCQEGAGTLLGNDAHSAIGDGDGCLPLPGVCVS